MLSLIARSVGRMATYAAVRPQMTQLIRPALVQGSAPALFQQVRGMKVRTAVKKYCSDCYVSLESCLYYNFHS